MSRQIVRQWTKPHYGVTHWEDEKYFGSVSVNDTFAEVVIQWKGNVSFVNPADSQFFFKKDDPDYIEAAKHFVENWRK